MTSLCSLDIKCLYFFFCPPPNLKTFPFEPDMQGHILGVSTARPSRYYSSRISTSTHPYRLGDLVSPLLGTRRGWMGGARAPNRLGGAHGSPPPQRTTANSPSDGQGAGKALPAQVLCSVVPNGVLEFARLFRCRLTGCLPVLGFGVHPRAGRRGGAGRSAGRTRRWESGATHGDGGEAARGRGSGAGPRAGAGSGGLLQRVDHLLQDVGAVVGDLLQDGVGVLLQLGALPLTLLQLRLQLWGKQSRMFNTLLSHPQNTLHRTPSLATSTDTTEISLLWPFTV